LDLQNDIEEWQRAGQALCVEAQGQRLPSAIRRIRAQWLACMLRGDPCFISLQQPHCCILPSSFVCSPLPQLGARLCGRQLGAVQAGRHRLLNLSIPCRAEAGPRGRQETRWTAKCMRSRLQRLSDTAPEAASHIAHILKPPLHPPGVVPSGSDITKLSTSRKMSVRAAAGSASASAAAGAFCAP
jgi:hypothetical protein